MLDIFANYFHVATRLNQQRMRDLPGTKSHKRGRWRASPNWRDLPEEF
ncbi:hypothetical protein [Oceanicola sp. 22II-s10i]|nr:hypothetical protein [Oceanicola sp. 22II-s10i]